MSLDHQFDESMAWSTANESTALPTVGGAIYMLIPDNTTIYDYHFEGNMVVHGGAIAALTEPSFFPDELHSKQLPHLPFFIPLPLVGVAF